MDTPYPRGVLYDVMPIPPEERHCIPVDAGPVRFVVESRVLTTQLVEDHNVASGKGAQHAGTFDLDDFGASLHVYGTDDGLEHLRFDCFEREPHYHYVRNDEQSNQIVRIDDVAEGDPVAWALARVRARLPEMLDYAGAVKLADAVRRDAGTVQAAADRVAELLERARSGPRD